MPKRNVVLAIGLGLFQTGLLSWYVDGAWSGLAIGGAFWTFFVLSNRWTHAFEKRRLWRELKLEPVPIGQIQ
jgi:uncharacterized protein (DUF58 family)